MGAKTVSADANVIDFISDAQGFVLIGDKERELTNDERQKVKNLSQIYKILLKYFKEK